MINTSEDKSREKTAKETEARARRRADQAQIVSGLQSLLEADEQLLGFTRGLIAGGLRGKLTVGFEALFAPYVNVGLTERRVVLQHVQPESGKPNDILPHSFPLSELQSITFSDIETFGAEPAARLNLRMFNDQHFRLRLRGAEQVESAQNIAGVFSSLTSTRPKARTSPTQSVCPHCDQVLDRVSRFCPYCGQTLATMEPPADSPATVAAPMPAAEPSPVALAPTSEAPEVAPDESEPEPPAAEAPQAEPKAARTRNRTKPSVETVGEEAAPEPATEGHETPSRAGNPVDGQKEGDRPL
jgi:hypothetical protein